MTTEAEIENPCPLCGEAMEERTPEREARALEEYQALFPEEPDEVKAILCGACFVEHMTMDGRADLISQALEGGYVSDEDLAEGAARVLKRSVEKRRREQALAMRIGGGVVEVAEGLAKRYRRWVAEDRPARITVVDQEALLEMKARGIEDPIAWFMALLYCLELSLEEEPPERRPVSGTSRLTAITGLLARALEYRRASLDSRLASFREEHEGYPETPQYALALGIEWAALSVAAEELLEEKEWRAKVEKEAGDDQQQG